MSQDFWDQVVYRGFGQFDAGITMMVFAGEHISSHGKWTKYRFFLESPGKGRFLLKFTKDPAFKAISHLRFSSYLLSVSIIVDAGFASNEPVPEQVVNQVLNALGYAEVFAKALKFGGLAGPLGAFTLGFTIGYEIGGLLGLGFAGRVGMGIAVGLVLFFGVLVAAPVFIIIIVAAAVIVIVYAIFKLLG